MGGIDSFFSFQRCFKLSLLYSTICFAIIGPISWLHWYNNPTTNTIKSNYLTYPSHQKLNLSNKKISKSVVTQVVHKLLNKKKNGFFIEAGANDGEFLSNTLELEVFHGWTGLLVEVDPQPLEKLLAKHRNAWIVNACLSPTTQPMKVKMITHKSWTGIGNIPSYFKGVIRKNDFSDPFEVQCFPLQSMLEAIGIREIDYFSLDIEGAEYAVLNTIPFDKVSIKVISVETNKNTAKITELLAKNGYKAVKHIQEPFVNDMVYLKS